MVTAPFTVNEELPECVNELFAALALKVNEAHVLLLLIVTTELLSITNPPKVELADPLMACVVPEKVVVPAPPVNAVPLLVKFPSSIILKLLAFNVPWDINTFPVKVVLALSVTEVGLLIVRFADVFCVNPFPVTCAEVPL